MNNNARASDDEVDRWHPDSNEREYARPRNITD